MHGSVQPILLSWHSLDRCFDGPDEQSKLIQSDTNHYDATGMLMARLGPLAKYVREVMHVVCDQEPTIFGGKRKDLSIVDALEFAVFVQRDDIVPLATQMAANDSAGKLSIQQQTHA